MKYGKNTTLRNTAKLHNVFLSSPHFNTHVVTSGHSSIVTPETRRRARRRNLFHRYAVRNTSALKVYREEQSEKMPILSKTFLDETWRIAKLAWMDISIITKVILKNTKKQKQLKIDPR